MTLLISAQGIGKSYGQIPLFSALSLNIEEGDRIGLIGPNGSGKSTILKILSGLEQPDSGKVVTSRITHHLYLQQEDNFDSTATVKTVLFGNAQQRLPDAECLRLIWAVTGQSIFTDLQQKVSHLSGGWRKRLAIVQALLSKPNLLLMDEPTNHLDLEGILWLEALLRNAPFSFIVISHDRYFLENVVNSIVEVSRVYIPGFLRIEGKYSDYLQKRDQVIAEQIQLEQSLANKMRREQAWLQRGPKARTTKAQYRIDAAEKLRGNLQRVSTSNAQQRAVRIDFDATHRKTKILLELQHISMLRNKPLFENLSFKITPGMCLGVIGQNGSGKSTLLNIIKGDLMPDSGVVDRAPSLRIVSFDQKREQLNKNQTLWKALAPDSDSILYKGQSIHVAAWAKLFLFDHDQLQQSVSKLSGGEQARVLIANLMLQPADILLLDEPTNDLDIATLEVLEESLKDFPGAIVLITHDRYLLEQLSSQILYLNGQGKAEFFADYPQTAQFIQSQKKSPQTEKVQPLKKKKISYEEQKELSRLPAKIQKAENELEILQQQLSNEEVIKDQQKLQNLCEQIEKINHQIKILYERWEELESSSI